MPKIKQTVLLFFAINNQDNHIKSIFLKYFDTLKPTF